MRRGLRSFLEVALEHGRIDAVCRLDGIHEHEPACHPQAAVGLEFTILFDVPVDKGFLLWVGHDFLYAAGIEVEGLRSVKPVPHFRVDILYEVLAEDGTREDEALPAHV